MIVRATSLLALSLLAGCGEGEPARVTINGGSGAQGGSVKVEGEKGFKADLQIPGLGKLAGNMDIDGVKPYPDSSFAGINIDAGDKRDEKVALTFMAPADRAKVAQWYEAQFRENGFIARPTPTGYAGETKDGDWFSLDLTPEGAGTRGEFKLGKARS